MATSSESSAGVSHDWAEERLEYEDQIEVPNSLRAQFDEVEEKLGSDMV